MEGFFVTDNTTCTGEDSVARFNADLFIAQSNPDDPPFLREFVHTHNLEVFMESGITRSLASRGIAGRAAKVSRVQAERTRIVRTSGSLSQTDFTLDKRKSFAVTGK